MTENDEFGCHFVGYFSKEKRPSSMNNVSCILVLPIFQRRGFGHMLIDFSYLLTKTEQKVGSPEKPLSDMGLVSYRGYWRLTLCQLLLTQKSAMSITRISELTGMTPDDIISALEGLRALVRDPVTKSYALRIDNAYFKEYIEKHEKKKYPQINPEVLIWTPYVMNRGLTSHYEEGGPMHAVAPREDDAEDDAVQTPTDEDNMLDDITKQARSLITNGAQSRTSRSRSPGHRSRPSTPLPNGTDYITSTPFTTLRIPPNRFEVFPPVPGMTNKRRPGRPFGSRTRNRPSLTPNNRRQPVGFQTGSPASGNRRTRSMLGEEIANGLESADHDDKDEMMGADHEDAEEEEEHGSEQDEDAEGEDDDELDDNGMHGAAMEVD
jgi:histone acetyltransferase SAS3